MVCREAGQVRGGESPPRGLEAQGTGPFVTAGALHSNGLELPTCLLKMQISGPCPRDAGLEGWVEPAGAAGAGGLWAIPGDPHLDSVFSLRLERWGLLPPTTCTPTPTSTPIPFLTGPGSQQVDER